MHGRLSHIRNFSIIAHIDHGKSTLADRLLEYTGTITERERTAQILDSMDLERERGITIKASAVRLRYTARDGQEYMLNLIDTPGHVDFTYEVSRSLAACEGALLVVDAVQGVEAQTVANVYLALDNDLDDPAGAQQDRPARRRSGAREAGDRRDHRPRRGGRGAGQRQGGHRDGGGARRHRPARPAAAGRRRRAAARADVRQLVRSVQRRRHGGARLRRPRAQGQPHPVRWPAASRTRCCASASSARVRRRSTSSAPARSASSWPASRRSHETKIGDTITDAARPTAQPLPGFKAVKPMVFSGLYPADTAQYEPLRDAVEKLQLNDSSFTYEPENSVALGFGFRCGFLGLLHMEIIRERLEREFGLSLITTAPTVAYRVTTLTGETLTVDSPAKLPPVQEIATHRRADHPGHHSPARELPRWCAEALRGEARPAARAEVPGARPRHADLRAAAERDRARLLRPPQVGQQGLRLARLRLHRHAAGRPGQARHPASTATRSMRCR